jgi:putative membrane protein
MSPNVLDALLAYLHFVALFLLVAFLGAQLFLLRAQPGAGTIRTLSRSDIGYLVAAILVLATGAVRLFFGIKGAGFYTGNPLLYVKLVLFLAIGLISIKPTLRFIRWRKSLAADAAFTPPAAEVASARRLVMLELHLLALIPLAAVFMARGMGL